MKKIRKRPRFANDLKDRATEKISEAFLMLKRAGCAEYLPKIASDVYEYKNLEEKSDRYYWSDTFKCISILDRQAVNIKICKPTYINNLDIPSAQSNNAFLEFEFGYNFSRFTFFERVSYVFKLLVKIVTGKIHKDIFIISNDDEAMKFKNLLKRIP